MTGNKTEAAEKATSVLLSIQDANLLICQGLKKV